jgi:CO dehydrogenase nickel-insertion accessory protein CooC1
MKNLSLKIIAALFTVLLIGTSANAASANFGVSIPNTTLEQLKTELTNSGISKEGMTVAIQAFEKNVSISKVLEVAEKLEQNSKELIVMLTAEKFDLGAYKSKKKDMTMLVAGVIKQYDDAMNATLEKLSLSDRKAALKMMENIADKLDKDSKVSGKTSKN